MEIQGDTFGSFLVAQVAILTSPELGLQLGVIAFATAIAWSVRQRVSGYLARTTIEPGSSARQHWVHALHILIFPTTMLLAVLMGRGILARIQVPVALLDIIIPLLFSLAAVRASVHLLHVVLGPGRGLKAWESVISTVIWVLVALHLVGWLPELLEWMDALAVTFGKTSISLLTVGKLIVATSLLMLVAVWIARGIERTLEKSPQIDIGVRLGLAKFSKYLLLTLAVLIALNSVGIDLTALAVFGGALGVGLGFGLQRIASNLVSGFMLIFERSIRPGDIITIGTSFGQVKELRARFVVVRSRDGVETLIPNENLITSEVINWTYSDRNVRIKVPVQISYNDDPELAMRVIVDSARIHPRVLATPPPNCLLTDFAENGINLELHAWISDPEEGVVNVRSEILLGLWHTFKLHLITIPFPQREVVIKAMPPHEPV